MLAADCRVWNTKPDVVVLDGDCDAPVGSDTDATNPDTGRPVHRSRTDPCNAATNGKLTGPGFAAIAEPAHTADITTTTTPTRKRRRRITPTLPDLPMKPGPHA